MNFVPAVAGLSASFIAGIGLGCNVTVVRRYEYANVPALEAAR